MLEYLNRIDAELGKRYDTLYLDLCSGSSSFFAAYRSLCERLMRIIVDSCPMREEFSAKTLTFMLSHSEITAYLEEQIGIPSSAIQKLKDYVLKINRQVHTKEKELTDDLAKRYMLALDAFVYPYAVYLGIDAAHITETDVLDAFMSDTERMQASGSSDSIAEISERINEMYGILTGAAENAGKARDEELHSQMKDATDRQNTYAVIAQFKRTAIKHIIYFGSGELFREEKGRCLLLAGIILTLAIPVTFFSVMALGIYSTYTLFENIWHIAALVLTFGIIRISYSAELYSAMDTMPTRFEGMLPLGVKRRYYVFAILSAIGSSLNIIFIFTSNGFSIWALLYALSAVGAAVLSFILLHYLTDFTDMYATIAYTGVGANGKNVTIMEIPELGKYYTAEDYCREVNNGYRIILQI